MASSAGLRPDRDCTYEGRFPRASVILRMSVAARVGHRAGVLAQVSPRSIATTLTRPAARSTERRGHPRYPMWFPVQVDGEDLGVAVGVTKDASAKGLLIDTNAEFAIGAPVMLTFRVSTHHAPQLIEATIVRSLRNKGGVWPYRVAVEFDDPLPHLEPSLRREARAQGRVE
jgi:hypothetical protein